MTDVAEMLIYLTGSPEAEAESCRPRAGDPVELRPLLGGREIEAWSPQGRRLGWLPPAEREALAPLLDGAQAPLSGRIAALVPRPRHAGAGRIHIRVTVDGQGGPMAGRHSGPEIRTGSAWPGPT